MLTRRICSEARRSAGFTLIELMVTVVVVSILAAIAVPSYMSSVRKSRRTEARQALLDLAGREERYLATNTTYSNTASDLGYSALPSTTATGYYTINVSPPTAPSATSAAYFIATASPVAGMGQDQDSQCASFTIDSQGVQKSTNSSGADSTTTCWQQ